LLLRWLQRLLAWLLLLCGLLLSLIRGGGDIPAWCDWAGLRCRCGLLLTSRWLRHIRSESQSHIRRTLIHVRMITRGAALEGSVSRAKEKRRDAAI
jgi:hypothetical protein